MIPDLISLQFIEARLRESYSSGGEAAGGAKRRDVLVVLT
jgi:hypothetical protein